MFKGKIAVLLVAALWLGSVSPALATPLFGTSFGDLERAVLYDVDPQTGLATSPRPTGINHLVGIAFSPGGRGRGAQEGVDRWPSILKSRFTEQGARHVEAGCNVRLYWLACGRYA